MARLPNKTSVELRAAIQAAVDDGIIEPSAVIEYLDDNGFEPLPTRMTVISILNVCGVVYVRGRWEKKQ
jgi:hypothetical protein